MYWTIGPPPFSNLMTFFLGNQEILDPPFQKSWTRPCQSNILVSGRAPVRHVRSPLGFSVRYTSGTRTTTGIIPFNNVVYNYGSVWSGTAYNMLCISKGLYYVHLNVIKLSSSVTTQVSIRHNSNVVQYGYGSSSDYDSKAIVTTIIELNLVDDVYANLESGRIYGDGNGFSHFMGFLIHETP